MNRTINNVGLLVSFLAFFFMSLQVVTQENLNPLLQIVFFAAMLFCGGVLLWFLANRGGRDLIGRIGKKIGDAL